jgi:uncharacterized protein
MPMQSPVQSAISPHLARLQPRLAPIAIGNIVQSNQRCPTNLTVRQAKDGIYNSNPASAKMKQSAETAEQFFNLGMMCSTGAAPLDMIEAHKWFNIAATLGMKEAMRLRNEVASEMSEREIAAAQRAARDWLVRR